MKHDLPFIHYLHYILKTLSEKVYPIGFSTRISYRRKVMENVNKEINPVDIYFTPFNEKNA